MLSHRHVDLRLCGLCAHTSDIVIYSPSFIEIRSAVWEPLRFEICPFPLLWLLAFTTACTAVQAVILYLLIW